MTDSKEHILNVSLDLFLQKNFKEVTLKDIVEKTGLSKGAFYHYFSSKEQVFEEVIRHFYAKLICTDYSKFSCASLQTFYNDILKDKENKLKERKRDKGGTVSINEYFMIFDAARMLSDFRKLRMNQREDELKAWLKTIKSAKKNNEISDKMSDEKLAKLFIYSAKGIGIDSIMAEDYGNSGKELKNMWDELYKQIKN